MKSLTQNLDKINTLYDEIESRLTAGRPFTSAQTAWNTYERLSQVGDIAIGFDYVIGHGALFLKASNRTHSLASLHIATRRGKFDYESRLTPERYANWCGQVFNLVSDEVKLLTAYLQCRTVHGDKLNGRLDRALALVAGGSVTKNGSRWTVSSQSGQGSYNILADGCSCPDSQHNAPEINGKPACKHLMAVWLTIRANNKAKSEARQHRNGAETNACKRCGLNWRKCMCQPEPTVAEAKAAARAANGAAMKPGGGGPAHRPAYQFTGHKYGWS